MPTNVPAQGEWPCQHQPPEQPPPRLIDFLYLLVRDLSPADIEQMALQVRHATPETSFTNRHLAAYARSLAGYLLDQGVEPCGRVLVGRGDDTWDPTCTLPAGHVGPCRPGERDD